MIIGLTQISKTKSGFWPPVCNLITQKLCESLLESQVTGTEILEPEAVWDGESGKSGRHHHEHLRTQWRLAYRRLRSSLAVSHGSANNFIMGLVYWFWILGGWLKRELQYQNEK